MDGETWNNADTKTLDENDFQDVRKETAELAGLWQGLATSLGLSPADVREIDLANRGDPSRCLDGVIEKWLNQNYDWQKFGPPSWRKLVSAVADKSGGKNTALAKRIAQKHPCAPSSAGASSGQQNGQHKPGGAVGMKTLTNDLAKVAHKWYQIGLQLGVNCRDLDKIKGEENGAQACLSKMLSHWLSTNAGATKTDLVDMLVSNTINEQQLARKLRNNRDIKDGPLSLDDLATLVDFLDPVASKWEDMGIQLDISAKKLDNLKATAGDGEESFLRKMLKKLESTNPNQTVERLCNALSSGPVGEKAMSESLRDKYARQGKSHLFESDE